MEGRGAVDDGGRGRMADEVAVEERIAIVRRKGSRKLIHFFVGTADGIRKQELLWNYHGVC